MDELQRIVGAILGVHEVAPSDRLVEDLEAESMDLVNIIAAIEDLYDLELDDAALAHVHTVADLDAVIAAARQ